MITNDMAGALQLLVVGMVTVFIILLIVINLGKLLIFLVNKFAPEEEAKKKATAPAAAQPVDGTVKSVIEATVKQITGGKGYVSKITKI